MLDGRASATGAKDDLRAWKLSRVVWVADRGFQSAENRRYLQRAGGHYILGEKLRGNDKEAHAALGRQGRYHTVAGNLRVKEVVIDDGTMRDRLVICHNPEEAKRDQQVREQLLTQIQDQIADTDSLPAAEHHKLYGQLSAKRGYKRFLRQTNSTLVTPLLPLQPTTASIQRLCSPVLPVEDIGRVREGCPGGRRPRPAEPRTWRITVKREVAERAPDWRLRPYVAMTARTTQPRSSEGPLGGRGRRLRGGLGVVPACGYHAPGRSAGQAARPIGHALWRRRRRHANPARLPAT